MVGGYAIMITSYLHLAALILIIPVASGLICAGLIVLLRPLLQRYALSRPKARSSHVAPTPQGGGIAVIAATGIAASLTGVLGAPYLSNAIPVVLTGIDVSIGDLAVLLLKLLIAGIPVGIVHWGLLMILRVLLLLRS